jgi:hypothetical protein
MPKKKPNDPAREHIVNLLRGGNAHVAFEDALKDVPSRVRGVKPAGAEHTLWQLLEHIRIAQWDILEFSRNPKHVSPGWPEGYWPESDAPPTEAAWTNSIASVQDDTVAMERLVQDPQMDLYAKIPHGTGQTILREALLIADHNAYHIGQFVLTRRMLNAWQK